MSSFLNTINELEEMEKKATPGPWTVPTSHHSDEWYGQVKRLTESTSVWGDRDFWLEESENEAQLIVSMRNNLPQLLAMARWALTHGFKEE